jgi:hypothetical protein
MSKYNRHIGEGPPGESRDRRVLFCYVDADGNPREMSCFFYRELWRLWPHTASDADRAKFVVDCRELIQAAKVANRQGGSLKALSDEARMMMREIPSVIPDGGFPSEDKIRYHDCLSAQEIECRLKAYLETIGLLDMLVLWEESQPCTN